MATVELREITKDTVRAVLKIETTEEQQDFVAPTSVSIAQAHFEPKAWFRAIYADDQPVGFIMLYDDADKPEYFLWRLLVGTDFQHNGYGRAAVEQLAEYVRSRPNATELLTSWVPKPGGPESFYRSLGFVPTGEVDEGEVMARLVL
jgi:diamine N-acetyltransferase